MSTYPQFCKYYSKEYGIPYGECLKNCQPLFETYKNSIDEYRTEQLKRVPPPAKEKKEEKAPKKKSERREFISESESSDSEDEEEILKAKLKRIQKRKARGKK